MPDPYRSEYDALRAAADLLRADLARAEKGTAELEEVKAALEAKLAELEEARISEEEKSAAARRVRARAAVWGLIGGLAIAAGVASAYAWWPADEIRVAPGAEAGLWFERMRPHCNPVEVTVAVEDDPAPTDANGQSYLAACFALAGRMPEAERAIRGLPEAQRRDAANRVFELIHPIADRGDDTAAGPAMELVLEFTPENYMATYHAGLSAYERRDDDRARSLLTRFRQQYTADDHWGRNAVTVLQAIEDGRRVHVEPEPSSNGAPWF